VTSRVAAIVVTYRAPGLTIACVESLLASVRETPHVIIVDNSSGDESVEQFRARFADDDRVTIHARNLNDGYTGGNNAGVALARQSGAQYAFILNNDTLVDADCLRLLVDAAESDGAVTLVTPRIFFGEPDDRLWFGGGKFSLWRGRPIHVGYRGLAGDGWTDARNLDYASGCALLVRLNRMGDPIFDDSLFTYAEDVDLSMRVRRAGGRIRYVPNAVMWHFEGSGHRRGGSQSLRFYLNIRNLLRVNARHARWYHWITLGPSLAVDVIGRYAAVAIRDRDWPALAAVFRGAWDSVAGGRDPIESGGREASTAVAARSRTD
jgi:GT2 family glycosyltransferase